MLPAIPHLFTQHLGRPRAGHIAPDGRPAGTAFVIFAGVSVLVLQDRPRDKAVEPPHIGALVEFDLDMSARVHSSISEFQSSFPAFSEDHMLMALYGRE